jgi:hypothetical protein
VNLSANYATTNFSRKTLHNDNDDDDDDGGGEHSLFI